MKTIPQLKIMGRSELIEYREELHAKKLNAQARLTEISSYRTDVSAINNNIKAYGEQLTILDDLIKQAK